MAEQQPAAGIRNPGHNDWAGHIRHHNRRHRCNGQPNEHGQNSAPGVRRRMQALHAVQVGAYHSHSAGQIPSSPDQGSRRFPHFPRFSGLKIWKMR